MEKLIKKEYNLPILIKMGKGKRHKLVGNTLISFRRDKKLNGYFKEGNEYNLIVINPDLDLIDQIAVLSHEIIHFFVSKDYIRVNPDKEEMVATNFEKCMKRGIRVIKERQKSTSKD